MVLLYWGCAADIFDPWWQSFWFQVCELAWAGTPQSGPFKAAVWASGLLRALQGKSRRTVIKKVQCGCYIFAPPPLIGGLCFGARQVGLGVCGLGGAGSPKAAVFKLKTWASGLFGAHRGNLGSFRIGRRMVLYSWGWAADLIGTRWSSCRFGCVS